MRKIVINLIAVFVACFGGSASFAQGSAYIISKLDFGQITPARSGTITVVIDARTSKLPTCSPTTDCSVTGGSMGIVEFSGFGNKTITMHYPSEIVLKSGGSVVGRVIHISMYSDATAQKVGSRHRVQIGGVLQTDQNINGQRITTAVPIDYSVN